MSSRKDATFGAVRSAMASVSKPTRDMFRRSGVDGPTREEKKSALSADSEDQLKHSTRIREGGNSPRRNRDELKDSDGEVSDVSADESSGAEYKVKRSPAKTKGGSTLRRRNVGSRRGSYRSKETASNSTSNEGKIGELDEECGREGSSRMATPAAASKRAMPEVAGVKAGKYSSSCAGNLGSATKLSLSHGIRGKPKETSTQATRLRTPAEGIPEVHFLGEIFGGTNLQLPNGGGLGAEDMCYSCRWSIEYGKSWSLLAGDCAGQSQYCFVSDAYEKGECIWDHPLDVHFTTASVIGWPRIVLQIWALDEYGRANLAGYGFTHLPTSPGQHDIGIQCWRPMGSLLEEIQAFFLGSMPHLTDEDYIFGKAWQDRYRLVTAPAGEVHLRLHVVQRSFAIQAIDGS
mmetsp:Transcript_37078/g.111058  ORF Transcript_37078/g.111058 Transcript_37078/m.111058 type:complete len:404 (+) Transcript_37078:2185-3396(+)